MSKEGEVDLDENNNQQDENLADSQVSNEQQSQGENENQNDIAENDPIADKKSKPSQNNSKKNSQYNSAKSLQKSGGSQSLQQNNDNDGSQKNLQNESGQNDEDMRNQSEGQISGNFGSQARVLSKSDSIGSMAPEKQTNIKKFIEVTKTIVEKREDLKNIYDEVASEHLSYDQEFLEAFNERFNSDLEIETKTLLSDIEDQLKMKGLYESESTGQFDQFFPILIAAMKSDFAGKDTVTTDIIELITLDLFKELSTMNENWKQDSIELDNFITTFCDRLQEELSIFNDLIEDINDSVENLRSFQNAMVNQGLFKSEIGYIEFVSKNQKSQTCYDIVRLYEILNLFDFHVNYDNEPIIDKDGNEIIDNLIMNNTDQILEKFKETGAINKFEEDVEIPNVVDTIGVIDMFLVLRDILDEGQVQLFQMEGDTEDIFDKSLSFKDLLHVYDQYFFDYLRLHREIYSDSKNINVDMDQMWNLIRYLINAKLIFIKSKNDKKGVKSSVGDLKAELERTLANYIAKLADCQSDVEKQVLKNTIDGLKMQLSEIGKELDMSRNHNEREKVDMRKKLIGKNIKECFKHYGALQQTHLQNNNTFDGAKDARNRMSMGEWMKFSSDFKIQNYIDKYEAENMDEKQKKYKVQISFLKRIFNMETTGLKGINFRSFVDLLSQIATKYPMATGSDADKIDALYENLGYANDSFREKMHGMKTAFYNGLPGPNLCAQRVGMDAHAEKKAFSRLEKIKIPNADVNKGVFTRLYKKPMTTNLVSRSNENPLRGVQNPNNISASGQNQMSKRYNGTSNKLNVSYDKKEASSYLVLERQRHIQDDKKKFTWESLEKMNLNELKGLTNMNFEPEDYIGEEDEEDKLYMREYNLANEAIQRENNRKKMERKIENYGEFNSNKGYHISPKIKSRYKDAFNKGNSYIQNEAELVRKKTNQRGLQIARESQNREREALDMLHVHRGKPNKSVAY